VKQTQSVKNQVRTSRRSFLRKSAIVGGGAAGVAALPGQVLAAEEIPEPEVKNEDYRMTEHIAEYYKSAKL
jgi:hypothetical protein